MYFKKKIHTLKATNNIHDQFITKYLLEDLRTV